jgi:hypothetical protein
LLGARFGINDAVSREVGETSWDEVKVRCRMYGKSDAENYSNDRKSDWSLRRRLQSLAYPSSKDLVVPLKSAHTTVGPKEFGLLSVFVLMRYQAWVRNFLKR